MFGGGGIFLYCTSPDLMVVYLKFSRNMLVEDLIDLEVRMTTSTRMFPITPTVSTMLWTNADDNFKVIS